MSTAGTAGDTKDTLGANEDQKSYESTPGDVISESSEIDLSQVLDRKKQDIDSMLDVLSSHISMIPANEYAMRVIELCQLSYIHGQKQLKSFFEWFIRSAVQWFIEITYAFSALSSDRAVDEKIHNLPSIQFILGHITGPNGQKLSDDVDGELHHHLERIVSYFELLPSHGAQHLLAYSSGNHCDYEYVIFHVARFLTADAVFSQSIIQIGEEPPLIPRIAQKKVEEWIAVIIESADSDFKFSADCSSIENEDVIYNNALSKPRNIIKATKEDDVAQVRPARAAAIVMDHVYGILVDG